jgi:hypothetical protein
VTYGESLESTVGISSRDISFDRSTNSVVSSRDNAVTTNIYRRVVRPWLQRLLQVFWAYRFGVYITRGFDIAHDYARGTLS